MGVVNNPHKFYYTTEVFQLVVLAVYQRVFCIIVVWTVVTVLPVDQEVFLGLAVATEVRAAVVRVVRRVAIFFSITDLK